jgi:CHAT domain-containing protein/tetratricopeptide (TPR) repeat protein
MTRNFSWAVATGLAWLALAPWIAPATLARGDEPAADAPANEAAAAPAREAATAPSDEGAAAPEDDAAARRTAMLAERDRLWVEAYTLQGEGKLDEAAAIGIAMYLIERQVAADNDAVLLQSLDWIAGVYEQDQSWVMAEAWFNEVVKWREAYQGPEYWKTINARVQRDKMRTYARLTDEQLVRLAHAQDVEENVVSDYSNDRLGRALEEANDVYSTYKELLGERDPRFAKIVHLMGMIYHSLGDFDEAERLYLQSTEIRKQVYGERHPSYAYDLNDLAVLYANMGDLDRTEQMLRQAADIWKAAAGDKQEDYALYTWYQAGEEASENYAICLASLGNMYQERGDYVRAEPLYREAMEESVKAHGEWSLPYRHSAGRMAQLYMEMGDYERAGPLLRRVLEIQSVWLGNWTIDYASALDALGDYLVATGEGPMAEPLFEEAAEVVKKVVGDKHARYAGELLRLAQVHQSKGDLDGALTRAQEALAIRKVTRGPRSAEYGSAQANLGSIYVDQGDLAKAKEAWSEALEISKQIDGEHHPTYAARLNSLAQIYEATGDSQGAGDMYRQAVAIVSEMLETTAGAHDEIGQIRQILNERYVLDRYLSFLLRNDGSAAEAYRVALAWKGATLVRQRADRLAAADPAVAQVLKELQTTVRQLSAMVTASAATTENPGWKKRVDELSRRKETLETDLSRRSAAFRAAAEKVDVAKVQQALPAGAALVDYLEFTYTGKMNPGVDRAVRETRLLAFVVPREGDVAMFDLGPVARTDFAIEIWRNGYGVSADAKAAGALLRTKIWTPLAGAIGDAQLVLVAPEGQLGKMPFGALPGSKPGTYLIEDVALAIVPVPQLIPALAAKMPARALSKDFLVVGGVDFDSRDSAAAHDEVAVATDGEAWDRGASAALAQRAIVKGMKWPRLAGTEVEATFIAALYQRLKGLPPGSDRLAFLSGTDATEEAFRAVAPQSHLLHVATHGFFAAADKKSALAGDDDRGGENGSFYGDRLDAVRGYSPGLLSGLVLAGANNPPPIPDDPAQFQAIADDGILTADEIASLPMSGARLVVLSACESGLGETAGGEGLLGIQRAFQVAGARTTIATLWTINDKATQHFMEEFYRNFLERKMSPLEAMRAAQLWALNNPDLFLPRGADDPNAEPVAPTRLPPYYWAAFTLSGDWR